MSRHTRPTQHTTGVRAPPLLLCFWVVHRLLHERTRTHQGREEPQRERGRRNARNRTLLGQNPQRHAAREAGDGGDTTDPTVRVTQPAHTALQQHTQESGRHNSTGVPAGGTQQVMHSLHAQGLCVLQHNPSPRPRCSCMPRGAAAPAVVLAAGSRRIGCCPCQESVRHTAHTHNTRTRAPSSPTAAAKEVPYRAKNNEHKSRDRHLPSQPSTTNTQQGAPAWTHTQLAWTDRQTPLAAQ